MRSFIVPGIPKGKARPRLGRFGTYTPKETVEYENWVRMCYMQRNKEIINDELLENELSAKIIAYFPIPKSLSKKKKQEILNNNIQPTTKPDVDNIAKSILDSLNGIAYKDDSQIVSLVVEKRYSEDPRVEVVLNTMCEV